MKTRTQTATGNAVLRAYSKAAKRLDNEYLTSAVESAGYIIPKGKQRGWQVFVKIVPMAARRKKARGHAAMVRKNQGKVVAYKVVYKPTKCKCWTPATGPRFRDFLPINWFYRCSDARKAARELNECKFRRYLKGLKEWDTLEFTVAKV